MHIQLQNCSSRCIYVITYFKINLCLNVIRKYRERLENEWGNYLYEMRVVIGDFGKKYRVSL